MIPFLRKRILLWTFFGCSPFFVDSGFVFRPIFFYFFGILASIFRGVRKIIWVDNPSFQSWKCVHWILINWIIFVIWKKTVIWFKYDNWIDYKFYISRLCVSCSCGSHRGLLIHSVLSDQYKGGTCCWWILHMRIQCRIWGFWEPIQYCSVCIIPTHFCYKRNEYVFEMDFSSN